MEPQEEQRQSSTATKHERQRSMAKQALVGRQAQEIDEVGDEVGSGGKGSVAAQVLEDA